MNDSTEEIYSTKEDDTEDNTQPKSFTDNDNDSKRPTSFHVRRILGFINYCILYALVFFHRMCPSILSADMAADYKVPIKDMSIFSSLYFYPYAILQPFAGLLADIVDPAIVIGVCQFVASLGGIICGFSPNITVGYIGRFLVGLGCGPTYVPITRTIANWFPLKLYAQMCGLALAIASVGGIIAQGPLSSFSEKVGWRWAFYGIGGLGLIFSITQLIFVRGDPTTHGYKAVNEDMENKEEEATSFKEKLKLLWHHFKQVVSNPWIWVVNVYTIFCSGPYFDVSGMWAGPYLTDCYGFSKTKVGNSLIALSIGLIIGSIGVPPISSLLKTRKWILCVTAAISMVSLIIFAVLGPKIKFGGVIVLFLLLGMFSYAQTNICYPLVREYFHPSLAGSAVGCVNIFTFLSSAIFQNISGEVIAKYPLNNGSDKPNDSANSEKGYKIGLWMICAIAMAVSTVTIAFAKESPLMIQQREKKFESDDEEKDTEDHDHEAKNLDEL